MTRFRLMQEKANRTVVFEKADIARMEELALAQGRSLSSVVREAVVRYLADHEDFFEGNGMHHPQQ